MTTLSILPTTKDGGTFNLVEGKKSMGLEIAGQQTPVETGITGNAKTLETSIAEPTTKTLEASIETGAAEGTALIQMNMGAVCFSLHFL